MNNIINPRTVSVAELIHGDYFYIPAYQRGYRWTKKQVDDMVHDLLCFRFDEKKEGDFYCLQPIIAKEIIDPEEKLKITGKADCDKKVWEIVDGQQRLTTIFVLYKYLMDYLNITPEELVVEENGKELYHLCYATRDSFQIYMDALSKDAVANYKDIDTYHVAQAYESIDKYIKGIESPAMHICERYGKSKSVRVVCQELFSLLNSEKDVKDGSVQFLWYELYPDADAIKEFQRINTGKIKLTDAELIKALFLLKSNFQGECQAIKQVEIAAEWEQIENALNKNNFWYFLRPKDAEMSNRIDFVFSLAYKVEKLKDAPESGFEAWLAETETALKEDGEIFRYYQNKFEGKTGYELQTAIFQEWNTIKETFRVLEDWYVVPEVYNYIGFLSQCGYDLVYPFLYHKNRLTHANSKQEFVDYLKSLIREQFTKVTYEDGEIDINYKTGRGLIRSILLFLNIHLVNEKYRNYVSMMDTDFNIRGAALQNDIYKFPFDLYAKMDWDIEHVDSFSTNKLKQTADMEKWIAIACEDLSDEQLNKVKDLDPNMKLVDKIKMIKEISGEQQLDEEQKNSFGNLTLLDATTNRSYGNSLFVTKRKIINERIQKGVFVLDSTQYIFNKLLQESTKRTNWTEEDMSAYNKYVLKQLQEFLPAMPVEE